MLMMLDKTELQIFTLIILLTNTLTPLPARKWDTSSQTLMLSGDCHPNPGPNYKYPCGVCRKPCTSNQQCIACDSCDIWYHRKCLNMPIAHFKCITANTSWICCQCGLPNFSSTLFETTMSDSINTSIATENSYSILSSQTDMDPPLTPTDSDLSDHSLNSISPSIGSPQQTSSPVKPRQQQNKKQHTFRVMIINFQSMRAKKQPFWLQLEELKPDVVIGTETWLYDAVADPEVLPSGYHMIARRDRKSDHHGGVIIAVKDSIVGNDLYLQTSTELTAASIQCPGKQQLIVVAAYRPPSSNLEYMMEMKEKITHLHRVYPKATVWMAGDINLPDIDWNENTIVSNQYNHSISHQFLDLIYDTGSEQMVKFPTRGPNTLDLFVTNRPTLVTRSKPMPGVSDHDVVFIETNAQATKKKPPRRKILLWNKMDYEETRSAVSSMSKNFLEEHSEEMDIDILWNIFQSQCIITMDKKIPSKMTTNRFSQPWISRKIKRLSRRKKRAYKKAKSSGNQTDSDKYRLLQRDTQYECKKAYNTYVKDIAADDNPKKLYSFIGSKKSDSSGVPLLKRNGIGYSDPANKASILNDQFSSVFTDEDMTSFPAMNTTPAPSMHTFTINTNGIEKLLKGLNPYKAQGPDNIPARFLREFAKELAPCLSMIYKASLQQGKIPKEWKQANVTPLFKKGDRTTAANYRPISLTSICCKLLEHVIHSQVMKHLDLHSLLTDQQHGFRKRRSCESQLILTLQDLASSLDEGEQIDAVLLDFSKAFDKVPHQRLLYKLQHYGLHGNLLHWIKSFLSGRTQKVLVEGHSSQTADVLSGVPQGSVLGPLLFLLYINDMPGQVSSTSKLFADDSLLYRKIKSARDTNILKEDLLKLEQWEKDWLMHFNPSKCEVVRFSRKRSPIQASYSIHNHTLSTVKSGKYLGVILNEKLSWNEHVDATTKKANNSLSFLRRNISSCPQDTKAQCYKALVRPIVEYASTVWDPHTATNIAKVEAVQRRAARFVYGDYKTTSSSSDMIARLQWPSLQQRRQDSKMTMMYRIQNNLVEIPYTNILRPTAPSTRGHAHKLLVPYCRTDVMKASFFPSSIRLWNQLPACIVTAPTLDTFRARLAAN